MPICASAPHHVTSIFLPVYTSKLETTGSLGAGLAVEPRAIGCLGRKLYSRPIETTTAARALKLLGAASRGIHVATPLPPAKGYAVSASTAVVAGTAYSVSRGLTIGTGLLAAHKAEILEKTGLGDVASISCGVGVVYRYGAGAPGLARVDCRPVPSTVSLLALEGEGGVHTRSLLEKAGSSFFRREARRRLERVFEDPSFETFMAESMSFTLDNKLYAPIIGGRLDSLTRTPGLIGFYAKKLVAIIAVEADMAADALEYLAGRFGRERLRVLYGSDHGVRVWWE
ncbi:MAG: hypothetical protein LRS48_02145 [Desulfurococcales archaeon]|nr:hypothetical protein [Desulfurococcales archaeon]